MFCNVTLGQIQKTGKKYFWFDPSAFVSEEEEEAGKRRLIEQLTLCELYSGGRLGSENSWAN